MYTYGFRTGQYKLDKNILGNKGLNLVNMTRLGISVPQGFIIPSTAWEEDIRTEESRLEEKLWNEVLEQIKNLNHEGKTFGDNDSPLLLSVRSGAGFSMPGMMDTILNIGLNDGNLSGLSKSIGKWAAHDSYRRMIQMFGSTVYEIHNGLFIEKLDGYMSQNGVKEINDLSISQLDDLIEINKDLLKEYGKEMPQDSYIQLERAVRSVFESWDNPGAIAYREFNGIPSDYGTAVVVQQMVFGNAKGISGTGVYFTRNPKTGDNNPFGEILYRAQGEDVVSGYCRPKDISNFAEIFGKEKYEELKQIGKKLENHFHTPQDIEFTVENGNLWILQTRNAKFTGKAAFEIVRSMLDEKLIGIPEAIRMITPGHIIELTKGKFAKNEDQLISLLLTKGIPASYGICSGPIALSPEEVRRVSKDGIKPILIMDHIDPNDVDTLIKSAGVITTKGGSASHMAIIMRALSVPGIVGARNIELNAGHVIIDGENIKEGEWVSFDGGTGSIYKGVIEIKEKEGLSEEVKKLIALKHHYLGKSPWSAACYKTSREHNRNTLSKKINDFISQKSWKSTKARTIDLLNHIFPESEIISSTVHSPSDEDGIRKALIEVINSGFDNSPRTTHFPERLAGAPWAYGPNDVNDIDTFLHGEWKGKYGGFSKWKDDEDLEAIIVSKEPIGKMNSDLAHEHFSFTVSLLEGIVPKVVVSINIGSPHLRQFERSESNDLIILTASINPNGAFNLGSIRMQIGNVHLKENILEKIMNSEKGTNLSKIKRVLDKIDIVNLPASEQKLLQLIEHGIIPIQYYNLIIKESSLLVAKKVQEKVFRTWWREEISLPHLMCALDDTIGSSVLEGQGRFSEGNVKWCLAYGVKGSEEKEKAEIGRE